MRRMALTTGERIGSYEVLGPLGAGGMGEVYRALDVRLGREVALKVLPAAVGQDPARRARFDREARLLAALNHPGIGAIYGVEETATGPLLVLELIPGLTLAERIARGPLPLDEALSIARQIADAVAYAHANSVVHRDLKPANVKCLPDGKVKVLDFGIAKALSPDSGAFGGDMSTVTPADTAAGTIMGTPDYMSPEQARGQEIDRRTDVWSLGCILYEMLSGRRAFRGETVADTLAAVLGRSPDWTLLPESTTPAVGILLKRCLQIDREQRVHDMSDVRIQIDDALSSSAAISPAARSRRLQAVEIGSIAVIAVSSIVQGLFLYRLVPTLAAMYSGWGMTLSFPLRMYIFMCNSALRITPVILVILFAVHWFGRSLSPRLRRRALVGLAAIAGPMTVFGLYFMAEDSLVQALRLTLIVSAPRQVLQRDLSTLYIASGAPERVIALIDPTGKRDDFVSKPSWSSPGEAFQLAEAYKAKGDLVSARRLYKRAQEAATYFDEVLTQQLLAQQVSWQSRWGVEFTGWLPNTSDMRRLPDLIKAVSQQRLDQLPK